MKRKHFAGLLTVGFVSLARTEMAPAAAATGATGAASQTPAARADAPVTSFMQAYGPPSAAIAVAKDGRLVHARGFGHRDLAKTKPITPLDRFRIASNSKPVTAVAVTGHGGRRDVTRGARPA